MYLIITV